MNESKREKFINKLVKEGQGCPTGKKLVNTYHISRLALGCCSQHTYKPECWLECCDFWVAIDTIPEPKDKHPVKSLFIENMPHNVSAIKVTNTGIHTGFEVLGEKTKNVPT